MQSVTNTFQSILITDGTDTYAVFIYECGAMEWGGGVIGWQADPSLYVSQSSSGDSDNNEIGCQYSSSYSAIVYKLSKFNILCYDIADSDHICYTCRTGQDVVTFM